MAVCGNCGAEGQRIRSRWVKNVQLPDECPACAPQSFEKQTDPSDKKIWIGPEYAPNDYEKKYDADGVFFVPKPEVTAERERKLFEDSEEKARYEKALAEKRANRRMQPMSLLEIQQVLRQVDEHLRPLIEDPTTSYDA